MDQSTLKPKLESITVNGMKWNTESKTHDDVKVHPPVFEDDGLLCVNGEHQDGYLFLDYYGEFRGGYPWICPELEAFAKEAGGYWEWQHPGAIALAI